MRREARILMNRQRIVAHPPAHLARFDQLLANRRHLYGRELRADRAFIIDVFHDLDGRMPFAECVAPETVVHDGVWRTRGGRRRATATAQQYEHRRAEQDGQRAQDDIEPIHPSGPLCQGSSSSPSSNCSSSSRSCASSTMRRLSATDRKSTRLNSSHEWISYAVFCLKKKINVLSISILGLTGAFWIGVTPLMYAERTLVTIGGAKGIVVLKSGFGGRLDITERLKREV